LAVYEKPYLTFDEQVELMRSRGLRLDPTAAVEAVERVGYYRLSGYSYPYRRMDAARSAEEQRPVRADTFVPGASLTQVIDLYDFDRRLKLLVMDALERVEIAVRVQIAYVLGRDDAYCHLDPDVFDGRFTRPRPSRDGGESGHQEWLRKLHDRQRRLKDDFVKHFDEKYDGAMPIWVAIEVLDLGSLSLLFQGCKRRDRDAIAQGLRVIDADGTGNGRAPGNWLRAFNLVRNICAHHGRLWNRALTDQIAPSHVRVDPDLGHVAMLDPQAAARVYPVLAVISRLLRVVAPSSTWNSRLVDLMDTFPADEIVSETDMGFPAGWRSLPAWCPPAS